MEQNKLTLGSLFDGSGGFPLGGLISGITPVWASEIEPFPIRVTTKRLPQMKHYGDVSLMDGGEVEPVDIITFGSPCQDMSIAGKREGLDGNRSGLFYEAVRIVKEMRCATDGKYPRYIVWENVPGAFSSNKGEDFKAVLEAVIGIVEPNAQVPMPEKAQWPYADLYMGDGWSVAYRTLDAQYWGVPQRRRRIYLVADLAGGSAGKILFESEGLSGYSAESFRSWQRAAGGFTPCVGAAGFDGYNGSLTGDTSATLGVNCGMSTGRNGIVLNDQGGNRMDVTEEVTSTLRAEAHHPPCVMESAQHAVAYGIDRAAFNQGKNAKYGFSVEEEKEPPIVARGPGAVAEPKTLKIRSGCEGGGKGALIQDDKSATLGTHNDQTLFQPKYSSSRTSFFTEATEELASTLMATDYKDPPLINDKDEADYIVRRLTPTECARLQGFPDWWCADLGEENPTDDEIAFWCDVFETHRKVITGAKKPKTRAQIVKWLKSPHSDSAEYKMWGNGIALPCVHFVLAGIVYYSQFKGK